MRGIAEYIKIEDLKPGWLYRIAARNSSHGIWLPQRNAFLISRVKFYDNYLFEEYHYDTGAPFGTVKPLEEIEQSPYDAAALNEIWEDVPGKEHKEYRGYPDYKNVIEYLNNFKKVHPKSQVEFQKTRFRLQSELNELRENNASEEEMQKIKDDFSKIVKEKFAWVDWHVEIN